MSFLVLPSGVPDFSKAVISLWFRVPQESINKRKEAIKHDNTPFDYVIPIICLGPTGVVQEVSQSADPVTACHSFFKFSETGGVFTETDLGFTPTKAYPGTSSLGKSMTTAPTCIGVDVRDPPTLFLRIQTNTRAVIEKAAYDLAGVTPANTYAFVGGAAPPNVDAVYAWLEVPDMAANETEYFAGTDELIVTADHWHHVLWSFSLTEVKTKGNAPESISANTSGTSRMWLAFDDKNYTKSDLSRYWPDESSDPNAVLTPRAYGIAGLSPNSGHDLVYNSTDRDNYGVFKANGIPAGTPSFSLANPTVPNGPAGIPATPQFVNDILRVEMAEFQMWTGVTLDPEIESNRRAFVDAKGEPVAPAGTEDDPRSPGEKLFGKKPDILLNGSSDWKAGHNTGTGGEFGRIAKIERYKPDPSLHGDQGGPAP